MSTILRCEVCLYSGPRPAGYRDRTARRVSIFEPGEWTNTFGKTLCYTCLINKRLEDAPECATCGAQFLPAEDSDGGRQTECDRCLLGHLRAAQVDDAFAKGEKKVDTERRLAELLFAEVEAGREVVTFKLAEFAPTLGGFETGGHDTSRPERWPVVVVIKTLLAQLVAERYMVSKRCVTYVDAAGTKYFIRS